MDQQGLCAVKRRRRDRTLDLLRLDSYWPVAVTAAEAWTASGSRPNFPDRLFENRSMAGRSVAILRRPGWSRTCS